MAKYTNKMMITWVKRFVHFLSKPKGLIIMIVAKGWAKTADDCKRNLQPAKPTIEDCKWKRILPTKPVNENENETCYNEAGQKNRQTELEKFSLKTFHWALWNAPHESFATKGANDFKSIWKHSKTF